MANRSVKIKMVDLSKRSFQAEIMDDFDLPIAEVGPVLNGLGKMNAWFGGHRSLIRELQKFDIGHNCHISDWGCGGGDTLRAIAEWSDKTGRKLKLTGVDAADAAIAFARQQSEGYDQITFLHANVLDADLSNKGFDIVISNLFTHHFNDQQWISLVKKMHSAANKGVIIIDLQRHWLLYYAVKLIARISRNKMARYDGPLSVKRSFKRGELKYLLECAGIKNYELRWQWPFRWKMVIYKA